MEIVVLRSDIARLVLGYLKNERLDRVSRIFCKTSPHLHQEFFANKRGLQAYSFFPELEEIICEYVKITRKVDDLLPSLNVSLRTTLQQGKLSDKVSALLDPSLRLGQCTSGEVTKNDAKSQLLPTSSLRAVRDNGTKIQREWNRKRKCRSVSYSSDDHKSSSIYAHGTKRRRMLEAYCFLGTQLGDHQRAVKRTNTSTCNELTDSDDVQSGEENGEDDNNDEIGLDDDDEHNDNSLVDKPANESTPCSKATSPQYQTPTVPELSQAILDNSEFQMKLVQNINEALHTSGNACQNKVGRNDDRGCETIQTRSVSDAASVPAIESEKMPEVSSSQLLDEMVKKIMEATEKDPSFDAIIEEVVGAPAPNKCFVSAGIQCNIGETSNEPVFARQSTDQQESGTIVPQTPLIIRNAMAASTAFNGESQSIQTIAANTSFGSLIDPNFSISKLIVLNSNESAQKHLPTDQNDNANTTGDQYVTQLTSGVETSNVVDDQVYFDAATGQLTFPLIFTNDGLLANLPFLVHNEVITAQLQSDNVANAESSRIETPLAESIMPSTDQLPRNSIVLSSGQKTTSGALSLQQKLANDSFVSSALPSSIDASRIHMERNTPSTCGIVNTKTFKSLSTPRKRASHVRTLTFSPKSSIVPSQMTVGTPLSSRRQPLSRIQGISKTPKNVERTHGPEETASEKTIIKEVEIIPGMSAQSDPIASESSNSCSVPPLFAGEENSNQTVICGKTPSICTDAANVDTTAASHDAINLTIQNKAEPSTSYSDSSTPKRKQPRRMAVRACKRQLSNDGKGKHLELVSEDIPAITTNENQENSVGVECKIKNAPISSSDKVMEEWLRMRNTSATDLDSRLRELNAKTSHGKIPAKETKNVRRKKTAAATVASVQRKKKCQKQNTYEKVKTSQLNESQSDENDEKCTIRGQKNKIYIYPEQGKNRFVVGKDLKEKNRAGKEKPKEFNVKITTPQKSKEKREEPKNTNEKKEIRKHSNEGEELNCSDSSKVFEMPTTFSTHGTSQQHEVSGNAIEIEKRTANIACLLDTPFKEVNLSGLVPPTPGIFAPSLETPLSKLKPVDEVIHSASFLFGSLTKSDLDTPLLSAITPGFRFTPLISKDTTPRSVTGTEYSSGGSYYRPDESDDLDRNIDRLLRDSAQKKCVDEDHNAPESANRQSKSFEPNDKNCIHGTEEKKHEFEIVDSKSNAVSVEIRAEKLMVEPIVLKRVKSFGSDAVDTANHNGIQIDPHYTLASGLPELSAEEDSSSSSSCTSNTSSKSSTSCTSKSSHKSSSSSHSSSTSDSSNSVHSKTVIVNKINKPSPLALENLSDISSTEDEEWQKLPGSKGDHSQLVSNDGEVRYPVRSWLTPTKEKRTHQTMIKAIIPLKSSTEKRVQHAKVALIEMDEIEENKISNAKKVHDGPAVVMISAEDTTLNRELSKPSEKDKSAMSSEFAVQNNSHVEEKRPIDVLTALNLSAKKQPQSNEPKKRIAGDIDIDDNAVSNLFVDCCNQEQKEHHSQHKAENILPQPLLPIIAKTCPRKCVQIEALPMPTLKPSTRKNCRTAGKEKNIVHKTLGFKAQDAAGINIRTTAPGANSPIPKINITNSARTTGQRVSPRLCKDKASTIDTVKKRKEVPVRALKTPLRTSVKRPKLGKQIEAPPKTASKTVKLPIKNEKRDDESKHPNKDHPANSNSKKKEFEKLSNQTATKNTNFNKVRTARKDAIEIPTVAPECTIAATDSMSLDNTFEEEDPLECCELISISENDSKRFHKLVYSGPDNMSPLPMPRSDFSNFKIVVAIDEHETYTWRMTDEITLFACAPVASTATGTSHTSLLTQNIRNIPKKRKVRITNTINSEDSANVSPPTEVQPASGTILEPSETAIAADSKSVVSQTGEELPLNAAEKIQIEDIESILSHLHGT